MKALFFLTTFFALLIASAKAQRQIQELASDWKFIRSDAGLNAPTANWETVKIPHTWNNLDGQDGRTPGQPKRPQERNSDYFRGVTWYARTLDIPAAWKGRRVFIYFEAASQVAKPFINGKPLGEHIGAFTAFCFELTPHLKFGQPNELRVQVDNSHDRTIAPIVADFNVGGGIYRPVHLLVTDPVCITPLDHASPGVYLTTKSLDPAQAKVEVKTLVSNASASAASVEIVTRIKDASGAVVATQRTPATIAPGAAAQTLTQTATITRPRLWNGLKDPYLYTAAVSVARNGQPIDEVVQPLGLRTIAITEADGFLLNGQPYPILGVNRHQDLRDHGWALTPADHERDVALIREIGATAVRLAHYPQSDDFYALCNRAGLLLWNEVPFLNEVFDAKESPDNPSAGTKKFTDALCEGMREMILQRYNHPSVAFLGLFNEIRPGDTNAIALPAVKRLNAIARELDPARITVAASDKIGNKINFVADRMAYNVYPGWYTPFGNGPTGDLANLVNQRYSEQKEHRVAISEYGAGGNPAHHQEGTPQWPKHNGNYHPEEWQSYVHERDWAQIQGNPKLWGTFIWVMFDFSSDSRNEGGIPGMNDKGLVTHDRGLKKDAFYFYKANWTNAPMAHIASRRLTGRTVAKTEVKVYSNADSVELRVNGKSLGPVKPDPIKICLWPAVTLSPGKNHIEAVARSAGHADITDVCDWTLQPKSSAP